VELGSHYTDNDWSQQLMTITNFIDKYIDNPVRSMSVSGIVFLPYKAFVDLIILYFLLLQAMYL